MSKAVQAGLLQSGGTRGQPWGQGACMGADVPPDASFRQSIRKARPLDKTQRLFDGGGLYLEVSPTGGKWWRQKYRFLGKEKRLAHGTYPDVSLADARERRDAAGA